MVSVLKDVLLTKSKLQLGMIFSRLQGRTRDTVGNQV